MHCLQLAWRTVNSARSAYACFVFAPSFFLHYNDGSGQINSEDADEDSLRCKIGMKVRLTFTLHQSRSVHFNLDLLIQQYHWISVCTMSRVLKLIGRYILQWNLILKIAIENPYFTILFYSNNSMRQNLKVIFACLFFSHAWQCSNLCQAWKKQSTNARFNWIWMMLDWCFNSIADMVSSVTWIWK